MNKIIKICGVVDKHNLGVAIHAGASHIGFVFHPKSPRNIKALEANKLAVKMPPVISTVALVADPEPSHLQEIMADFSPRIIQFHGNETPAHLIDFRKAYPRAGLWKAIGIADEHDLNKAEPFHDIADKLLFDAKPPTTSQRTGGHGISFDWSLLNAYQGPTPWLLAGGLTPNNVGTAIHSVRGKIGFAGVDVSSGIESSPGQKDPERIKRFIHTARSAMDQ